MLLYTSVLVSTNNWSVDLYSGDLQTTTVFFTLNFTQGWLNSYCLSSALSCPLIVQNKWCNERSWSRRFVFSASQELYLENIVVCALCTHCCLCVLILVYPYFSHACCCCFTWNNGALQTATVFFTRNFTQGWLNSYCLSSAVSRPFIVQH